MWMEWRSCGTFVCPIRSVPVERGPTNRRSVNVALHPLSCMTGSTWGSWPCYPWCYTGFSLSGTLERRGGSIYTFQWFLLQSSLSGRMWHLWWEIQFICCWSYSIFSLCIQFQCPAAARHCHVRVLCFSGGHPAGHWASGTVQHPFLSSPDAIGLVHHAVQPQSRLRKHVTLHPGGCLSTVSTSLSKASSTNIKLCGLISESNSI